MLGVEGDLTCCPHIEGGGWELLDACCAMLGRGGAWGMLDPPRACPSRARQLPAVCGWWMALLKAGSCPAVACTGWGLSVQPGGASGHLLSQAGLNRCDLLLSCLVGLSDLAWGGCAEGAGCWLLAGEGWQLLEAES